MGPAVEWRDPVVLHDAPVLEMLGHYVDELVRTPAGWRFPRREAYSDVPYISLEGII
jgi:hypothetical protein